ncbi:helix-turn-helix transcriptional regulator [Flavobacterium sp. H4147]|uniref:helix-turn-helix domain-containing protein n=1 Tax=Flavobacterium sp. H4147 TaxID=3034149 RepID=UPI0023ECBDB6|nr:helix-turn-helix transcriptional regulator [Flavobacterium sp. H4147]
MENNKILKQLIEESTSEHSWKEEFQLQLENEESEDFFFELSLRIITRLEELGWKKSKLAEELGVTKQYVSKLLRSKQNLGLETIFKIQKVLGVKLIEIPELNPKKQEKAQITIKLESKRQTLGSNNIYVEKITYPNQKQLNSKWLHEVNSKYHC